MKLDESQVSNTIAATESKTTKYIQEASTVRGQVNSAQTTTSALAHCIQVHLIISLGGYGVLLECLKYRFLSLSYVLGNFGENKEQEETREQTATCTYGDVERKPTRNGVFERLKVRYRMHLLCTRLFAVLPNIWFK